MKQWATSFQQDPALSREVVGCQCALTFQRTSANTGEPFSFSPGNETLAVDWVYSQIACSVQTLTLFIAIGAARHIPGINRSSAGY